MILDFAITPSTRGPADWDWEVFDCRTSKTLASGGAFDRMSNAAAKDAAILAAVGTIARHTPTRLFVLRSRSGYSVWHPEARAWLPMPLTPAATDTDAFDMAAGFAWSNGRSVEVLDMARF
jgi:hypothetical protein